MTRHVITLVNLPEVFDIGPAPLQRAFAVSGVLAVDVRLRGGFGPVSQRKLADKHVKTWKSALRRLYPAFDASKPATWPTYADVVFDLAQAAGLELWGHGWLEALTPEKARTEAAEVVKTVGRFSLLRWGCNAEIGVFGPQERFNKRGIETAIAFAEAFREGSTANLDWMGFASLRWMYGPGVAEFDTDFTVLWDLLAQMVYQENFDGKAGAEATCERGRKIWAVQTEADCWTLLIGCGRWDDKNGDGVATPSEVYGDLETTKKLVAEFRPTILRHYYGNGAAPQIATGNAVYPAFIDLVPALEVV